MVRGMVIAAGVVALTIAFAIAWTAPTVVVAAPLWIMALCVLTGYRLAQPADPLRLDDQDDADLVAAAVPRVGAAEVALGQPLDVVGRALGLDRDDPAADLDVA